MAFSYDNWDKLSNEGNTNVSRIYAYYSTADALATIEAADYFLPAYMYLRVGDRIYLTGSDGVDIVRVTAVSSTGVTVATYAAVPAGSIVNADINAGAAIAFSKLAALPSAEILVGSAGNVATAVAVTGDVTITNAGVTAIGAGAVDLAMLSTGITPSHVVKFAGQPTSVGGAAGEAFTVTGIAATDLAFVQIVSNGTNNVTVLEAVCTLNTLTITFSGDPGADTIFNYQILRAAA